MCAGVRMMPQELILINFFVFVFELFMILSGPLKAKSVTDLSKLRMNEMHERESKNAIKSNRLSLHCWANFYQHISFSFMARTHP